MELNVADALTKPIACHVMFNLLTTHRLCSAFRQWALRNASLSTSASTQVLKKADEAARMQAVPVTPHSNADPSSQAHSASPRDDQETGHGIYVTTLNMPRKAWSGIWHSALGKDAPLKTLGTCEYTPLERLFIRSIYVYSSSRGGYPANYVP